MAGSAPLVMVGAGGVSGVCIGRTHVLNLADAHIGPAMVGLERRELETLLQLGDFLPGVSNVTSNQLNSRRRRRRREHAYRRVDPRHPTAAPASRVKPPLTFSISTRRKKRSMSSGASSGPATCTSAAGAPLPLAALAGPMLAPLLLLVPSCSCSCSGSCSCSPSCMISMSPDAAGAGDADGGASVPLPLGVGLCLLWLFASMVSDVPFRAGSVPCEDDAVDVGVASREGERALAGSGDTGRYCCDVGCCRVGVGGDPGRGESTSMAHGRWMVDGFTAMNPRPRLVAMGRGCVARGGACVGMLAVASSSGGQAGRRG